MSWQWDPPHFQGTYSLSLHSVRLSSIETQSSKHTTPSVSPPSSSHLSDPAVVPLSLHSVRLFLSHARTFLSLHSVPAGRISISVPPVNVGLIGC